MRVVGAEGFRASAQRVALYALRYGRRSGFRGDHFLGYLDDSAEPHPTAYYIWLAVSPEHTVVIDTGMRVARARDVPGLDYVDPAVLRAELGVGANHPRITEDSITGFDWESTNTATVSNVRGIKSPLLIMSMTGHYWLVASEMYYRNATQAQSRTLAFVEGATHGFTPCERCATTPGMFGDTVANTFNFVDHWLVGTVLP